MTFVRHIASTLGILAGLALASGCAHGAGAQETGMSWSNTAELTFVMAAGNSSSSTFGLKNALVGKTDLRSLKFEGGAIRTESGRTTFVARGTATDFTVSESTDTEVTAESYYLKGRYDRKVSDRSYLFGGAGWDRNTFAGVANRYSGVAGAGVTWVESETSGFKTDLGVTYTSQDDVVGDSNSFAGLRLSWDGFRQLTETTKFETVLVLDENLDDTDDFRTDFTNSIAVAISQALALKASLQLLYDNLPSLVSIPLEGTGGTPTGTTVLASLDKLDSVFTLALVVNF